VKLIALLALVVPGVVMKTEAAPVARIYVGYSVGFQLGYERRL
jgi:hypothetical protein